MTQRSLSTPSADLLDCSRPATFLFWFAVGTVLALVVMSAYGAGRWTSLLRVGADYPLLDRIERELGSLSGADATGHDGQLYYSVARDPTGRQGTPEAIARFDDNGPRYRYRRILFPLLAGGFGQFGAEATLFGMVAWLAVGMGLATVAIADICFQLKLRGGTVLTATVNAGALMSLLLLTADAFALGLALGGIALALRSRTGWAVGALALAALTKEVYILVPCSLACLNLQEGRRRAALLFAVVPALPVAAWSLWLWAFLPDGTIAVRNVGLPLFGIVEAIPIWLRDERNRVELLLAVFASVTFLAASVLLAVGRSISLRWMIVPWVALGCCATAQVWGKPNNGARVFAILWPLSILLLSELLANRPRRLPLTAVHSSLLPRGQRPQ